MPYTALFLCFFSSFGLLSQWTMIGEELGQVADLSKANMVFHPETNEPHVAYPDVIENTFVVQRFNGESWLPVGESLGETTTGIAEIAVAFHPLSNELYVAYPDNATNQFYVQRYTGTAWEIIGTGLGAIEGNLGIDIAFHPETYEPHIIYPDPISNTFLVQKFNGTNWEQLGLPIDAYIENSFPGLVFHPISNALYIHYIHDAVLVQKYDTTSWTQIGEGIHTSVGDAQTSLVFDPNTGKPYISFPHAGADTYHVQTHDPDSDSWSIVDYFGATSDYRTGMDLYFDQNTDRLYLAYLRYNEVEVAYTEGTEWEELDEENDLIGGEDAGIALKTHPVTNEVYVLLRNTSSSKMMVYRFGPTASYFDNGEVQLNYYPNPSSDFIEIVFDKTYSQVVVEVFDPNLRKISEEAYHNIEKIRTDIDGPTGIYLLRIIGENGFEETIRLLKE